jgi:MFS family permease
VLYDDDVPGRNADPASLSVKRDLRILRQHTFRNIFLARAVSLVGTSMAPVALAFAVLGQPGGSAARLGVVLAGRSIAQVVFMIAGGALADRFPRYRMMVASDLLGVAAQGSVAALFIAGHAPIGVLTGLSALNGAANALFIPASRGLIPQIVAESDLQSATALIQLSQNSASLAGAALSGAVIVALGAGWALAIDAATFLASAVFVLTSRAPRGGHGGRRLTLFSDLREGWQEFRSRQWVWVIVAQFALVNLCFTPCIYVLGPVVAKEHWGGALGWSAVVSAQAIGLIAGSFLAIRIRPAFPLLIATLATFGFLPPFFLLAAHAPVWLAASSMLVNGAAADVFEVLWQTALQEYVPGDKLSRVTSYDALGSFVLGPIGLLLVGPVAAAIGTGRTLFAAGVLVALGNIAALSTPSVRRLPAGRHHDEPAKRALPADEPATLAVPLAFGGLTQSALWTLPCWMPSASTLTFSTSTTVRTASRRSSCAGLRPPGASVPNAIRTASTASRSAGWWRRRGSARPDSSASTRPARRGYATCPREYRRSSGRWSCTLGTNW